MKKLKKKEQKKRRAEKERKEKRKEEKREEKVEEAIEMDQYAEYVCERPEEGVETAEEAYVHQER